MLDQMKRMIKNHARERSLSKLGGDIKEFWDRKNSYNSFWKRRLHALGQSEEINKDLATIKKKFRLSREWARKDPEMRFVELRELARRRNRDPEAEITHIPPQTRKTRPQGTVRSHHKSGPRIPHPSPRPDATPEKDRILQPPAPISIETRTPVSRSEHNSKVGYFASIKRLEYYSEIPKLYSSPYITIGFEDREDEHLTLSAGEEWKSEWYETEILRGVNIDVIGKYRLNYLSNGSFEL